MPGQLDFKAVAALQDVLNFCLSVAQLPQRIIHDFLGAGLFLQADAVVVAGMVCQGQHGPRRHLRHIFFRILLRLRPGNRQRQQRQVGNIRTAHITEIGGQLLQRGYPLDVFQIGPQRFYAPLVSQVNVGGLLVQGLYQMLQVPQLIRAHDLLVQPVHIVLRQGHELHLPVQKNLVADIQRTNRVPGLQRAGIRLQDVLPVHRREEIILLPQRRVLIDGTDQIRIDPLRIGGNGGARRHRFGRADHIRQLLLHLLRTAAAAESQGRRQKQRREPFSLHTLPLLIR